MALSLEYVQRRFERAAQDFPGLTHVLFCRKCDALQNKQVVPRRLQPAPSVNLSSHVFLGVIAIDMRQAKTPPHLLDGWDFAHWHFLRFGELLAHDVNREFQASKLLHLLAAQALSFVPNSQRIAGHDEGCEWLLILQSLVKPKRHPAGDGWYAVIEDVFSVSVSVLGDWGAGIEVPAAITQVTSRVMATDAVPPAANVSIRVSAESHSVPHPDGPDRIPGLFWWKGKMFSGLQPAPWRLLNECWKSPKRATSFQGLDISVWHDVGKDFEGQPLRSAVRKVRGFFEKHQIPLRMSSSNRTRTVMITSVAEKQLE